MKASKFSFCFTYYFTTCRKDLIPKDGRELQGLCGLACLSIWKMFCCSATALAFPAAPRITWEMPWHMIRRMPKQFWQLDPSSRREDTWFQWRVEQPEQQLQGEKIWNINGLNMERRKDAGPLGYGCRFDQVSCGCGSHAKFCSALEQVRSSALLKRLKIEDLIHRIDSARGRW